MFSDPLAMREPGVGIPFLGTLGSRALASQLLGLLSSGCLDLPENLQLRFVTLEVAAGKGLLIPRHRVLSRHYRRNTAARSGCRTAAVWSKGVIRPGGR